MADSGAELASPAVGSAKLSVATSGGEDRFRSLFENSIDAVLLSDPAGSIEAANPEACRLFGYSETEICALGRSGLVALEDDRLARFLEERERTGHFRGELNYRRKDGSKFVGAVSSALFRDAAGATKAAVIIRDVTEQRRTQEVLRTLSESAAAAMGPELFQSLVKQLANAVQARICFLAQCTDQNKSRSRTLALWADGAIDENIEYALSGTPCANVLDGKLCEYPEALQVLFPNDDFLRKVGAESYLGVPLLSREGDAYAHLALLDDKPRRFTDSDRTIAQAFATRAVAELERERATEILHAISAGTANATGADFYRPLAQHLAQALHVRYCFLAECTDASKMNVRMLSFWTGDGFGDNMEYNIKGHPCENVIPGKTCVYPKDLQKLFPDDQGLVALDAHAYVGLPAKSPSGEVLGHLVVLHTKPRAFSEQELAILHIFAARAGAELARKVAAEQLRTSEARLRVLVDINNAVGNHLVRDELFGILAQRLKEVLPAERFGIELPVDDNQLQGHILSAIANGQPTLTTLLPAAGTACHWVIENRQPYVAGACAEFRERFPVTFEVMSSQGMESLCALPLVSGGRPLGALFFMAPTQSAYTHLSHAFFEQIALQVAIAVDNMQSYEAINALNQTISATAARRQSLLEINNAIVSKLSRDELMAAVCDALSKVIWFDRLALSLYDAEKNVLRIVAFAGPYRREDYSPIGRLLEIDDSAVGQAFCQLRAVLRHDLESDRSTASDRRAYEHGFRSLCALPLIARGKAVGAITVGSLTRFQYGEAEASFLMEVANQVAIAIENMQLHEETAALKARFEAEAVYLQEEIKTEHNFEEIIGQSAPVREMLRQVEQVAPTDSTVLIRGETGTGKELLARAVHDRSKRKDRPLVKVNCGSIPSGLVESELFGHEKGAFTGALQQRVGRFELANGGTIFLDEVTELPLDTQVKLLRVLQEGEFERVGSSKTIKIDVRVIAATNRDLKEVVGNGTFRSDLFYRLNVFPLEVPALRERKRDIPLLVNFFLSKFGKKIGKEVRGVDQRSMASLVNYPWPGNIRELQNVIERSVVVASGPVVKVDDSLVRKSDQADISSGIETLENAERNHILSALKETNWVVHGKKGAAELLGINPSTLRSRMEKLGIKREALGNRQ